MRLLRHFIFALLALPALATDIEPAKLEFFETKIRPLLVDNCYECHSLQSKKTRGGLTLDTREGVLKGGDTGPSIVAGDPEKSLLIKAIRYADENLQMPPKKKGKLSDDKIAYLVEWIKMGAPDPRGTVTTLNAWNDIYEKSSKHWAFQPIKQPAIPPVKNERWIQNPVDALILSKLESKNIKPSQKADKRTLIRRASFGLTGLPPTIEEVEAFEKDDSPEAFERVVDRLLASPAYGERWARHWLDIARYADTKGYVFQEERRYPYAYTYRDYVIRAFNSDLPYDRFIIEQLAADHLELGEDKRPLAAMGFLTLGRRFLNQEPDIIDDRIDVTMRGIQGLTVPCARCHDHKFDPIPTKDYYSLYGVFASSIEPAEKPLLGTDSLPPSYPEYKAEAEKRATERADYVAKNEEEALNAVRERTGDYLLTAFEGKKLDDSKTESLSKERKLGPGVTRRWINSLETWSKTTNHPIFGAWFAFAKLDEKEFATKAAETVAAAKATAHPRIAKLLEGEPPKDMKDLAKRYGELFSEVSKDAKADENLRKVLFAEDSPANVPKSEIPKLWEVRVAEESRRLQRRIEELDATHPGAPPRAMSMKDRDTPRNPRVFVRGNAQNPGPEVPRQFLEIIAGPERKPFAKGSGRLEMAEAIVSKDNPLTARVFVNRVWLQHFGSPLVRTPSDFGLRSEKPVQLELLDYIAWRFMEEGWSIKKLHKLIMLSNVYQQRSDLDAEVARLDPLNEFYAHANRRRLEWEPMRDTLLAVSGALNNKVGGQPQDLQTKPFATRRTIYGFIDRQNLPGMFRAFDLASPDSSSPQRFNTTVPQQALFMMNGPFAVEQARTFVARPEIKQAKSADEKIALLYEIALQRPPDRDELRMARRFLDQQATAPGDAESLTTWTYGYGEIDTNSAKLVSFTKLPSFEGNTWQGGKKLPDDKLDWVSLTDRGGHPGGKFAAVRRWTAPRDGRISITGVLRHDADSGDGVRGWVLLNSEKSLGKWTVKKKREKTDLTDIEVHRGDTIEFVVDKFGDINSDSFTWSPTVSMPRKEMGALAMEWSAQEDFSGPKDSAKPLDSLERLAQVILMSNELVFVD